MVVVGRPRRPLVLAAVLVQRRRHQAAEAGLLPRRLLAGPAVRRQTQPLPTTAHHRLPVALVALHRRRLLAGLAVAVLRRRRPLVVLVEEVRHRRRLLAELAVLRRLLEAAAVALLAAEAWQLLSCEAGTQTWACCRCLLPALLLLLLAFAAV